ncbi:hypothetical protein [Streptomyces sp. GbtcB6]|uniref:hypothetical protein n=1 Tax=Streptomyces sp. GbtcB6 TaxID=2824751 RepID=UPI001C2FBF0F|nr:hypothetical protein [Streptomyces sp. GbtcB6]
MTCAAGAWGALSQHGTPLPGTTRPATRRCGRAGWARSRIPSSSTLRRPTNPRFTEENLRRNLALVAEVEAVAAGDRLEAETSRLINL